MADLSPIRLASFPIAQRGYAPMEVHRLLVELDDAHAAGRPLAPLVRRSFGFVTFGYDPEQVDAYLASLAGSPPPPPASVPSASTPTPIETPPTSWPAPRGQPLSPPLPTPAVKPAIKPAAGLLPYLMDIRFHMTQRAGYDVGDVDRFLTQARALASKGSPVAASASAARFRLNRGGGYEPKDVDAFMDRLGSFG